MHICIHAHTCNGEHHLTHINFVHSCILSLIFHTYTQLYIHTLTHVLSHSLPLPYMYTHACELTLAIHAYNNYYAHMHACRWTHWCTWWREEWTWPQRIMMDLLLWILQRRTETRSVLDYSSKHINLRFLWVVDNFLRIREREKEGEREREMRLTGWREDLSIMYKCISVAQIEHSSFCMLSFHKYFMISPRLA